MTSGGMNKRPVPPTAIVVVLPVPLTQLVL